MSESAPSTQEWRDLYQAAKEFKEIGSWDWMLDSDIFGVQNPTTGGIGYCCVLGHLGEVFALAVYLGGEGLAGYLQIQSGEILPDDIDVLHLQRCLMASFEDRRFLDKSDLRVIRELGLKFRGRNSWPQFRSYRPGYHPWYLTSDEASYLTLALQQAVEVSLRFREDRDLLTPPKEGHYLVRVPGKRGEALAWRDKWLAPPPVEMAKTVGEPPIDEVRLERIKKTSSRQKAVWEIDFSYFPSAVGEGGERPYYPYAFLWVDHHSGLILNADVVKPAEYALAFPEQFLKHIEGVKYLPREILVRREEVFQLLNPIASRLGIRLRLVQRLSLLEEAWASMYEFFA